MKRHMLRRDTSERGIGARIFLSAAGSYAAELADRNVRAPMRGLGQVQCLIGGTAPERWIGQAIEGGCDHLIFVDAVDFGAAPGSVILLNSEQMSIRYPQVSTHKISLGLLGKWAEGNGRTKAWLLGVQPESLRRGAPLSPAMQTTLDALLGLLQKLSLEVAA